MSGWGQPTCRLRGEGEKCEEEGLGGAEPVYVWTRCGKGEVKPTPVSPFRLCWKFL